MTQGFVNPYTYAVSAPTITTYTSGSGTYTVPAGVQFLVVEMVGGGGGGAGSSSSADGGTGGTGGTSTFGSSLLTCTGGAGGTGANPSVVGAGGTATLNSPATGISFNGQSGGGGEAQGAFAINQSSGPGGNTPFLGGGQSISSSATAITGQTAIANTGSGGGGGVYVNSSTGAFCGAGGGAGAYVKATISNPSATYSYAVGAGGTAGTAGTSGAAGGAGAAGIIIIYEYYQTLGIPTSLTLPLPVNQGGTGVSNSNWTAGSLTFSPTTQGIVGTTTNNNASAGYVGEFAESNATVTLTSNVYTDITSISLTAGDWDVYGNMLYGSSANATTLFGGWTTQTSASYPGNSFSAILSFNSGTQMSSGQAFAVPYRRYSLSATTTIYLTGVAIFSSGTGYIDGRIYARRVR